MALAWVDIPVVDLDRAIRFYEAVLGVAIKKQEIQGRGLMGLLPRAAGSVGGCLAPVAGGTVPTGGALLYLNCRGRLDQAEAAVPAQGGQILQPRHLMGSSGLRVLVQDSEGNQVALLAERALPEAPQDGSLLEQAETMAAEGQTLRAWDLGRRAAALGATDPEVGRAVRRLLSPLIPEYHVAMMNDVRRTEAWDKALRRAIRPGARVLEIGTGGGMLALMAARAGAGTVTTCEFHQLVAALATDIVAVNGYSDRIKVIPRTSLSLQVGPDLQERAELLFCDNFSDNMFSFQPLHSIADARSRLLVPGAPALPAAASVRLALADWDRYARFFRIDRSGGFDLSPMASFLPDSVYLEIGDPGVVLRSEAQDAFRFDFSAESYPETGQADLQFEASADGVVSGICQWIRLELDADTVLEARPEPGAISFSNPRFYPLLQPVTVRYGDRIQVHARHDGKSLSVWADTTGGSK